MQSRVLWFLSKVENLRKHYGIVVLLQFSARKMSLPRFLIILLRWLRRRPIAILRWLVGFCFQQLQNRLHGLANMVYLLKPLFIRKQSWKRGLPL